MSSIFILKLFTLKVFANSIVLIGSAIDTERFRAFSPATQPLFCLFWVNELFNTKIIVQFETNHLFLNIRSNEVMYISRRRGVASCAPTRSAPWGSWRPTARPSSRDSSRRRRAAGGSSAAGGPDTSRSPEHTCLVKDL